ncbi:MAG: zinc-dependent peptidase [Flavobacteriales bacterium]|nr:zinc-dependent peptidase [Flavobacteriales bacterium]
MLLAATVQNDDPIGAMIFFACIGLVAIVHYAAKRSQGKELDQHLHRSFTYYRGLSGPQRSSFRARVVGFVEEKDFHGRGIEVTREMETLIAACAIQLTFGLPEMALAHFTKVVIYPDRYRSRMTGSDHIGEVNPGMRAIVLSWKHFTGDYAIPDDARNLGLHEMAHALWFENRIPNDEYDFLDRTLMQEWRILAQMEAEHIHAGKSRLFRDYAGTNQEEFFAVAVEYFFEQSVQFKKELPELYKVMAGMLKQDPTLPPLRGIVFR